MPLIECSLCARLFHTSKPYPNTTGKIFLPPHHRGSNKLRKLSNPSQAPESENTQLGFSYLRKLSSKTPNDTTMGAKPK